MDSQHRPCMALPMCVCGHTQEAARLKQLADTASEMQAAAQKASEAAARDRKAAEAARKVRPRRAAPGA